MLVPNRHGSSNSYRYGFQGQEKDDELKGEGNSLNYTYRMHDPRVGRFFATDPLESKFPFYSPYQFSSNSPIMSIELEGLESSSTGTNVNENGDVLKDNEYNFNRGDLHEFKEVVITAPYKGSKINSETGRNQDNATWTPEVTNQYYPSYSKDEYIQAFGIEKYYQYTSKDAVAFHNWTLDKTKESKDWELLYKLDFLQMGMIALGAGSTTFKFNSAFKKFNYTPRYSSFNGSPKGLLEVGDDIALGLNENLFSFAQNRGFKTYRDFSSGLQIDKIHSVMNNPSNRLHFNLDGFSSYKFSKFNPNNPFTHGNITNWELHTILNNPSILERTTFYRFGNATGKPSF